MALGLFVWRGFLPAWRHLLTDFPNYYLAGRLFRDGVPLDRLYDWEWLQRQKDHLGLDQPLVGFVPLTMFSALLAAPLTSLSALAAKHVWLVFNLLLLPAIGWLLRAITGQPLRRVALIGLLAVVPLRTNFQFGQQHLFVLFLLTVATWCYFRGHDVSAGAVLAVAAAVKLYPAGFVLLLVRKRRWRALASMAVVGLLIAAAGIALFGVEPWSVFAREIVPRAVLRAEVTDPYDTHMSSLAGMLRRLLIFEPELNPHPLAHAPAAFAVLQPLLAAGILATGLWLLTPGRASAERERLDWAATLAFILLAVDGHADLPPVRADPRGRAGGGLPAAHAMGHGGAGAADRVHGPLPRHAGSDPRRARGLAHPDGVPARLRAGRVLAVDGRRATPSGRAGRRSL